MIKQPLKLGIDKQLHPTHYTGCNYLSMLWLVLIHISKTGPKQVHYINEYDSIRICCKYSVKCLGWDITAPFTWRCCRLHFREKMSYVCGQATPHGVKDQVSTGCGRYLNQCWIIINKVLWHSLENNLNISLSNFFLVPVMWQQNTRLIFSFGDYLTQYGATHIECRADTDRI